MIKFFRKIRQQLLSENKFSKYLLYALGEIVLVVIGILIALQINNVNEQRKLRTKEHRYLERLKVDLAKDTVYYNERILKSNEYVARNLSALKKAYEPQVTKEDFTALMDLQTWDSEQLTTHDATYYELLNAGNLDVFQNEALKIQIINHYRNCEAIEKHIAEFNEFTVALLLNAVDKGILNKYQSRYAEIFTKENMINPKDWDYINNPSSLQFQALELAVSSYMEKHRTFVQHFEKLKMESVEIIELINKELL